MNLRKISIGLLSCSAFLFASCSKGLSYKEALEFVKNNYKSTGVAVAKTGKENGIFQKLLMKLLVLYWRNYLVTL